MCSARSLGSRLSSSVRSSGVSEPRGRVPAMGRVSAQPSASSETRRSGRRADELVLAEVQVAGEGARVHRAQRVVQVQARQRVAEVQALADIGLEDVAGEDVLARAAHDLFVPRLGEVAAEHRQVVAVERGGGGAARGHEGFAHARRRGRRRAVVRGEAVDEHRLAAHEVVAQQPARQKDVDVGDAEVVAHRVGEPLEVAHGVVAEQADQGLGLGQVRDGRRERREVRRLPQRLERRERGEGAGLVREGAGLRPALAADAGARRHAHDPAPRAQAEDGVPGEVVPAGELRRPAGRVQQHHGRLALEPERADERDRIERGSLEGGDGRGHAPQSTRRRRTRSPRSGAGCGTACSRARSRGGSGPWGRCGAWRS